MMQFEPTLIVTRVAIYRGVHAVYDESFHAGVNVIRGENSSGKSTILNFIFFGLGGDLLDWSPVAILCDRVILEVRINGRPVTLWRDVSETTSRPMNVFGGPFDDAMRSPLSQWVRYPYVRSESRESFSQAIFRLMNLPEVSAEASGNVTMHQLLRLLYADQLSPVEDLFRFERFDPAGMKEAVARLLCGAYDNQLYQNELEVKRLTREFDDLSGELKSLLSVSSHRGESLTLSWLDGQQITLREQGERLQREIERAEEMVFRGADSDSLSLAMQDKAYRRVQILQRELLERRSKRDALILNIADSTRYIESLERKLEALQDSSLMASHVDEVHFHFCPSCYSALGDRETPEHACHLCKSPLDVQRGRDRIAALINDAALQLRQSRLLQGERQRRVTAIDDELKSKQAEWRRASTELNALQRLPSSKAKALLRELHQQYGYLQRELEDLERTRSLIEKIDAVSRQKAAINERLDLLRSTNEALRKGQQSRLASAYTAIADEVRDLLRHDLRREAAFENPGTISFDFQKNTITVDGQKYFSASSRVILKSSFFLGMFSAATKKPYFRHPRFVMIDTTEDKGMEPQRSHNFQNMILRKSREALSDHQIIYATAMISPDLDDEEFTIGKFSTRDDPTIAIEM